MQEVLWKRQTTKLNKHGFRMFPSFRGAAKPASLNVLALMRQVYAQFYGALIGGLVFAHALASDIDRGRL